MKTEEHIQQHNNSLSQASVLSDFNSILVIALGKSSLDHHAVLLHMFGWPCIQFSMRCFSME